MKFIDKKERVMDLKLTSYGHYLFSIGKFKPEYYAFYDDNVLYDGAYANITESSNTIHDRIKNKTQYMESQVLFEEIETTPDIIDEGSMSYYESDITPTMERPRKDNFRYAQMIGDSFLQGETQHAPAWKVVVLQGNISSSTLVDSTNDIEVPQINVQLNYRKKITPHRNRFLEDRLQQSLKIRKAATTTSRFADNRKIELEFDDLMLYVEEQNTNLLVENFDIEIFEVISGSGPRRCPGCAKQDKLKRIYFDRDPEKINGGLLTDSSMTPFYQSNLVENQGHHVDSPIKAIMGGMPASSKLTSSVGYYFDVRRDAMVNHQIACRAANGFNKQNLYIDLEFDCENRMAKNKNDLLDIYGPVTESEICQ
mgnify:FL=1